MSAYVTKDRRTVIQTSAGTYDISEFTPTSYPVQSANVRPIDTHARRAPYKKITRYDLRQVLAGYVEADDAHFENIRAAFLNDETIQVLCLHFGPMHYWLADYIMPALEPQSDADFFPYNINPASTGDNQFHGTIIDGVAAAVTGVPAGASSLIYVKDVGTATALSLQYVASGTTYKHDLASPSVGIHAAKLQTAANTPIPASRPNGNLSLITTPANAQGVDAIVGFGTEIRGA